jgi:hypothetical protein
MYATAAARSGFPFRRAEMTMPPFANWRMPTCVP